MRATRIRLKQVMSSAQLVSHVDKLIVISGQGMNASMNDAHNLGRFDMIYFTLTVFSPVAAWKLAFVIRGWAEMSLLSTVS